MTPHLKASKGEIAETVLLPGDPLRAKWIAENFLENTVLYSDVRGMLGFTGTFNGKKVSVQGSGMGVPSIAIYASELIQFYGVQNLIRIGTAGSLQKDVKIRDIVIATTASASTPFSFIENLLPSFSGNYSPSAHSHLLLKAAKTCEEFNLSFELGSVLSSDTFYDSNPEAWKKWASLGSLAVEMETYGLYSLASYYKVKALSLLTISDSLVTGESTSAQERQSTFSEMVKIALHLT